MNKARNKSTQFCSQASHFISQFNVEKLKSIAWFLLTKWWIWNFIMYIEDMKTRCWENEPINEGSDCGKIGNLFESQLNKQRIKKYVWCLSLSFESALLCKLEATSIFDPKVSSWQKRCVFFCVRSSWDHLF